MKSEESVCKRALELIGELKCRFVKERTAKRHLCCAHNRRCVQRRLDFRYCTLKSAVKNENELDRLFLCEDDEWVCNCPDFKSTMSPADAEEAFNAIIRSPSQCGKMFPHLAALLWVLNDGAENPKNKDETDGFFARLCRLLRKS